MMKRGPITDSNTPSKQIVCESVTLKPEVLIISPLQVTSPRCKAFFAETRESDVDSQINLSKRTGKLSYRTVMGAIMKPKLLKGKVFTAINAPSTY